MASSHIVMGLLFFPRGGSAQVARYLSLAVAESHRSISLVTGSLGDTGDFTHAPTFFAGCSVQYVDYSEAMREFESGRSALSAPSPLHPSFEDRVDAPDLVFSAVPMSMCDRLSSTWLDPFRNAGADNADVFHLHHLTPQHDLVSAQWPDTAVVAHLHGTEIKFIQEVNRRALLARRLGTNLASMSEWVKADRQDGPELDDAETTLLETTRWDFWQHGIAWRDKLVKQAQSADHLVLVSPTEREQAIEVLQVEPDNVSVVPNGVDLTIFRPRSFSAEQRRASFRQWLVNDPQGWDETTVAGSVAYTEADLDRLLGPNGNATVFLFVGRFTHAKRVPLLIRSFVLAQAEFNYPTSLVVWGGFPGEWEDDHPVAVARQHRANNVYFAGWRGHADLPQALAVSDALVLPSVHDSYPQAPLEAMAVGLPVIATNSGGFPYMINLDLAEPTGWLVPADDQVALSVALIHAVNNPEERMRRGQAALTYATRHLSWSRRVDGFDNAYSMAQDSRSRRQGG